ncbi:MAG TPA: MATE family efflux transporter [Bacteroidales bacterium]|nr:MAG: MATE family efflux transporter [Bacteroidetes bacterium GWE2_42_24]OFY26231.1 MAG: MATE family efflux transporter [Bacteroidetes bacterium GWF2_43_11]PKP23766.1 MAG: MATE family efflux transporter [Bacteroidetes bacterium HGW-Bacteroidetes-22]HBZ67512.1 MATE family efflux transporter [Bacteroidales bacterium]
MNSHRRRVFRLIGTAIGGSDQDFTSMRVGKAIFLLSLPMVLEMLMESIFAVIDIFFVSQLGADAIATVGLTESLMVIVYSIGFGFSMATTALVARRIGEKNSKGAAVAAGQAILIGLMVSIIIAIPGALFAGDLLSLMGASPELVARNAGYTHIMFAGNTVVMLLFIINAIFRSAGDAAISMRVLMVANLINIVLDPILIFGWGPIPAIGIEGAAFATNIGRGIAVLYQLKILAGQSSRIHIQWRLLRPKPAILIQLIKLSLGAIGQNLIATASWIFMVRLVSHFGSVAMAGYTIGIRVIMFSLMPSSGLGNAAATLVGQNLGAGKPDRAQRSVWITGFVNMALLGFISVFFIIIPEQFIRLFIDDYAVIVQGALCLKIVGAGMLFYAMGMVMHQALNGAGDTITPTLLNLICFWAIEIPLAWFLALKGGFNVEGVYLAIVIAESTLTLLGMWVFSRGKWKLKKI